MKNVFTLGPKMYNPRTGRAFREVRYADGTIFARCDGGDCDARARQIADEATNLEAMRTFQEECLSDLVTVTPWQGARA